MIVKKMPDLKGFPGSLTAWVHRMPLKALLGFIFFVNF